MAMSRFTPVCWLALALMGGAGAFAPAWGQAASAPAAALKPVNSRPSWSSLTAQQRQALSPLERDWSSLDAPRKSKWLEVATRFPAMPQADQQRVQERMAEWARMTPAERGRARLSYQESKQFSPEQKQARWEAYQALPDDERRALANINQRRALANRNQTSADPALSGANSGKAAATSQPLTPQAKTVGNGSVTGLAARSAASGAAARPVAPTMVQAKPGATTTLMTTSAEPPAHHRPGEPKIAAKPGQVDSSTLLPQSGPQATASSPRLP